MGKPPSLFLLRRNEVVVFYLDIYKTLYVAFLDGDTAFYTIREMAWARAPQPVLASTKRGITKILTMHHY